MGKKRINKKINNEKKNIYEVIKLIFEWTLKSKNHQRRIFIYYTTRGLKILDYTRRVARKHHEIVYRVVFPATRRVIENFPSSSCIRVDYIMNKINK
jgi:hypothetical protein